MTSSQVGGVERRLERPVHLHLLDQLPLAFGAGRGPGALADVDPAAGHERLQDDLERRRLVVEVVHRVVEDRGVEAVGPRQLLHRHGVELGDGRDVLADRPVDVRHALARDLDHVLGDVDPGHPVAAAREELAQPTGAAADVEHLGAQAEPELFDDVRERAQTEGELVGRRRVERLRSQPEPAALGQVLDVGPVTRRVILAEARQPPGTAFCVRRQRGFLAIGPQDIAA